MVASHTSPNGDLAHNPDMCLDWESNWQLFSSQAGAQSTEPHLPGHHAEIFKQLSQFLGSLVSQLCPSSSLTRVPAPPPFLQPTGPQGAWALLWLWGLKLFLGIITAEEEGPAFWDHQAAQALNNAKKLQPTQMAAESLLISLGTGQGSAMTAAQTLKEQNGKLGPETPPPSHGPGSEHGSGRDSQHGQHEADGEAGTSSLCGVETKHQTTGVSVTADLTSTTQPWQRVTSTTVRAVTGAITTRVRPHLTSWHLQGLDEPTLVLGCHPVAGLPGHRHAAHLQHGHGQSPGGGC